MGLLDNSSQKSYYEGTEFGGYQFISLENVINNFIVSYVGDDKIISKLKRGDVAFHAQRALQELSFDTFKSTKSQEIVIPPSLTMVLPQDYVNYVKLVWSDSKGVERIIYPTSKTSNPLKISQDVNGVYQFTGDNLTTSNDSTTWENFKSDSAVASTSEGYKFDDAAYDYNVGQRYGIDPQYAQANGSWYIDPLTGKIHFGSSLSGKTLILHYISDGLGTDSEMVVPKLAEEAMYKCIAYGIMSTRANVQEFIVRRFQKDKFAAVRKAKLRLSNLKLEELTQILRGKSKQIKH